MGSNLRRQLREALPPSIKGLQRAVALEIADDARYDDDWNYSPEKGRRSRVRLAELVRWTAAKDELSVREMLRRLSLAGWEFRLPIGKDKNGNPLYAVPGKAMTFRVPDFEGPTTVGPEVEVETEAEPAGPTTVGPEDSKGPTVSGQGPTVVAEGPTVVGAGPTVVGAGPTTVGPPSLVSSFSTKESPSSSPVAEGSGESSVADSDGSSGGGGGDSLSLEEITQQAERAEAFVDSLTFHPGKPPGRKQRQQIVTGVAAALKAGWTERGLRRYLDVSDDPNARSAAALYVHRLSEDELPDATADPTLPPACWTCLGISPAAATDLSVRVNPITGDPCAHCHPDGQLPAQLPEVCDACMRENPAARTNIRFRYRIIDDVHQACPDCHPKRMVILAAQKSQQQQEVDDWADRAMARAQQRMQTGNWNGAGTDERAAGWMALAQGLGDKPSITDQRVQRAVEAGKRVQRQSNIGRNYSNEIWNQPADPAKAAKIPHCGSPDCDPVTRLKTEPDWTGEPRTSICSDCHPAMKL